MALTYEQAVAAARAYLKATPFPYPEYRYVATIGRPAAEGWYFSFAIERVDGHALGEQDAFGGAPGYLVSSDDGQVRVIDWKEWGERRFGEG
jgi:hypothetical protein